MRILSIPLGFGAIQEREASRSVGAAAATLMSLVEAIRAHVFAAERIHTGSPVPVLAKGKTGHYLFPGSWSGQNSCCRGQHRIACECLVPTAERQAAA